MIRPSFLLVPWLSFMALAASSTAGQETPYFITYSHQLEEPGNLEISINPVFVAQRGGNDFLASWTEFEYGVKGWWTAEFYLDGQSTFHDSTIFTGWRLENRFRPFMREHFINPVLYFEFEDISGADKTLLEVVNHDSAADAAVPNAIARREHQREVEMKLILSSNFRGWNGSVNFINEKNIAGNPWEFGYAMGVSRPLRLAATPRPCNFCSENFLLGAEFYGGLGTTASLTLSGTSHYAAPILAWQLPNGMTLRLSPGWGLNEDSHRFLFRWGVTYEVAQFGRQVRRLFE
ncbi:MAG TPA: hypothetical protein VGT03_14970 [Candidatus Acidoferrales bacterium]|nr:hypothetical protein [Candidatus Acidoferrales bacterium]